MSHVDISKIPNDACSCGWAFYRKRIIIKKISRILAGTTDDMMVVKEFMVCEKCGKPHESSMAEFVAFAGNGKIKEENGGEKKEEDSPTP